MSEPTTTELATPESRLSPTQWRFTRRAAFVVYAGLVVVQLTAGIPPLDPGLPVSPIILLGWLGLASAIWSLGRDRRELVYALIGWGSLAVAIRLYSATRGVVDNWWGSPVPVPGHPSPIPQQAVTNARWILGIDRVIGLGNNPSEWLQRNLYIADDDRAGRWEILTALTYMSHFFVVYVMAIVQWLRDRREWLRWVLTLSTMMVFGVVLYMLVPTAPPWLAAPMDLVDPVSRVGTRSLHYLNLSFADRLWKKGAANANEVAAFPSLHFGFTVMVSMYFWRGARPWVKGVLAAYPLLMAFTLVYGGEHYVFDCVAGAALAYVVVWFNRRYMPRLFPKLLGPDQPLNRNASSSLVNSSESSSTSAG